jgi:hypothetical protein
MRLMSWPLLCILSTKHPSLTNISLEILVDFKMENSPLRRCIQLHCVCFVIYLYGIVNYTESTE